MLIPESVAPLKPEGLVKFCRFGVLISLILISAQVRAANFYVSPAGTSVPPFSDWASAATNIQDAIDVASAGDLVWVTNGIYSAGGKIMAGMSNRVVLDKPLRVQSVNGPAVTIIEGAWDPATNGPLAMRCAALTNGAVLSGFTARGGASLRATSSQATGGGVFGSTTNATVTNCIITGNSAYSAGAGAYSVTLIQCTLEANRALGDGTRGTSGDGGGAARCNLVNCFLRSNFANGHGGGATDSNLRNCAITRNVAAVGGGTYQGTLVNCTITGNTAGFYFASAGGGTYGGSLTNCISLNNVCLGASSSNYYIGSFTFCCSSPLPAGAGNLAVDSQLLGDGIHISVSSPCRASGNSVVISGSDIDGQSWATPPSIGRDEWSPEPLIGAQPHAWLSATHSLALNVGGLVVAGAEPFGILWSKDGSVLEDGPHFISTHTTNLLINSFGPSDVGNYQVVASNTFGMATSSVVTVVVHCADALALAPVPPYSDWSTAAADIQSAIDVAAPGDFVLVTNGAYSAGGRVIAGDLTNRVALTKPINVASVNGADMTVIEGAQDPVSINGALAVRCAWMTEGATLSGFTLRNGATRTTGDLVSLQSGGGLYALSTNVTVLNCVLSNNAASYAGGGAYLALIANSKILTNRAQYGGGSYQSILQNSYLSGNSSGQDGAAVYSGTLINCTVLGNIPPFWSYAVYDSQVRNSIVRFNTTSLQPYTDSGPFDWGPSTSSGKFFYCCAARLSGNGNITNQPQLFFGEYLSSVSPCRGAGSALYSSGTDIEGEPWLNPPSMGCDEFWEAALTNNLSVNVTSTWPAIVQGRTLIVIAQVTGRPSRVEWNFGDGTIITNVSYFGLGHLWTNVGDYTVTFTAFNAANPTGVSANLVIHVIPLVPPTLSVSGLNSNRFNMSFAGQPGIIYILEQTPNLIPPAVWGTVTYLFGAGDILQATDTQATDAMRFYRVRIQ